MTFRLVKNSFCLIKSFQTLYLEAQAILTQLLTLKVRFFILQDHHSLNSGNQNIHLSIQHLNKEEVRRIFL